MPTGKPARRACAILGLHPRNFASGWLACLRDKEFFNKQGGQSARPPSGHIDCYTSAAAPGGPSSQCGAMKADACASRMTPSCPGCPFALS